MNDDPVAIPRGAIRKDYACLDESPSEDTMNQRSRVRRFDDFNTVWGRKVRHDPFKIGEAGAVPVTPTTLRNFRKLFQTPLRWGRKCGIICVLRETRQLASGNRLNFEVWQARRQRWLFDN
jgi:hypothetical protein